MGTTKKHIGMNISRQNTNDSIDTPIKLNNNNNNNNNNTSSCSSINNMINQQKNQQRNNVYLPTPPTSKNIIINSNTNHNYNDSTTTSNNTNNNNNTNNRKNDSLIKNNSAYLTTRRCLNKKSQLNINSSSKNNLNESKNINSYINKLSLAKQIQQDQKHQQQEQQQQHHQQQKNSFNQQHSNSFGFEKSKLENRNHNLKNPIVSVLNNSSNSNSNSISSNINRKVSSKASVENYLKPFYLNEYSKCEKENSFNLKTKKSSIKELKISNITNIQASIERYESNQLHHHQQQQQHHHHHHHHHPHLDTCSQLDTPVIYLNSSLNTNFSLNHHNCFNNNNNNNNNNSTITTTKITNYDKLNEENHEQQKQFGFLNQNSNLIQKIDRPASILSLNKSPSSNHTNLNQNQNTNNENDSVVSFSQLTFNETNNDESDLNMLSSQSNIVNASATSFRLTQSQKEKQQCKAFTLKSNKSIASSSSSSQNLIASLNQSQISKLIAATATITPNTHTHSNKGECVGNTSTTSKKPSTKLTSLTCTRPSKTSNHQEYEGGLVEKMASFIDELKDFIDDRLIDTTSQLELANQRISGLYFNLNYLTSELINLKKQNEELKKELIFKNNTTRSLIQEQQYLETYSEYSKKVHNKNSERYIDSSCMKIPDSNSNLESTMNNSSSKTTSPETTSASSTSTSTSLIISQTPHDNLYKKSASPPQIYQRIEATPKSSKDFKTGKHFEHLNDLELKRRETCTNTPKIQSSSSSINSINFYDNMSIVNRFEINWPTRSATDNPNNYSHRTSSPSQIDLQNLIQTQYASTDFDNDELYESNEKNYELIIASQSQQTNSYLPSNSEAIHYETGSPTTKHHNNNDLISNDKDLSNEIVHSPTKSNLHHLHASIVPYNNLIADFDTQYIWDYENNSLVHNNKFNDKSIDGNMKFQN